MVDRSRTADSLIWAFSLSQAGRASPSAVSVILGCKHVRELHFLGPRPAVLLNSLVSFQNHSQWMRVSGGSSQRPWPSTPPEDHSPWWPGALCPVVLCLVLPILKPAELMPPQPSKAENSRQMESTAVLVSENSPRWDWEGPRESHWGAALGFLWSPDRVIWR